MLTGDNVCGELFCWFCLRCDAENVKNLYSIMKQQESQEAHSGQRSAESRSTGERDNIPTSEWKLTNDDMNALINACHCCDRCAGKDNTH